MENAAFGKRGRVCYTGRMMKRFLWICALCALTAALCACALAEETPLESLLYNAGASEIYVAPWGDDNDAGTFDEPLQTLGEALLRVRGGVSGATIWLRGGRYELSAALQASWDLPAQLSIRAYGDEEPVVTGSVRVEGWRETDLCGQTVWAAQTAYGAINALYGDDGARQSARWPKMGSLWVAGTLEEDAENAESNAFARSGAFYAWPESISFDPTGCRVRLVHWWKDECTTVRAYSAETGRITLNRPTTMTVQAGDFFWLENVWQAPMTAGEWAFDEATRTLYYCPRDGETMENTPLYAGVLTRLLAFEGVSGLTLEGITFAQTGWNYTNNNLTYDYAQAAVDVESALVFADCDGISIYDCVFRDMSGGCVRLGQRVKNASVMNCDFIQIGAQALYICGRNTDVEADTTSDISFCNNVIEGYGRVFLNAPAVLVVHAARGEIVSNTIRDGYYSAVSVGWVWGKAFNVTDGWRIASNLIENIGQGMLSDLGGIYLLGVQNNTVVEGNVIRNVQHATNGYGGRGIFLDEGASGITIRGNLCYNCSSQGYFQHYADGNTLINNIFAFNAEGQIGLSDNSGEGNVKLQGNVLIGGEPYIVVVGSAREGAQGDYRNSSHAKSIVKQSGTLTYTQENSPLMVSGESVMLQTNAEMIAQGFAGFALSAGSMRLEDAAGMLAGIVYEEETAAPQPAETPASAPTAAPAPEPTAAPAFTQTPQADVQTDSWSF